ncbi:MAG: hypothetical protein U0Q18_14785 [Bryobacteraceae bacterium]
MAAKKSAAGKRKRAVPSKAAGSKNIRKAPKSKNSVSQPRKTGGGRATHAGTNYQNRVSAWWAVLILAEADVDPPFELPDDVTFVSLHAETTKAVDDLTVNTSTKGEVLCQAKHTVTLETTSESALGKTVAQFVRQFRVITPKLDPTPKDRLVLVTTSLSSAPIKTHLPAFLARLRTSAAPQKEWNAGSRGENQAAAVIRNHVMRTWRAEYGKKPTAAEIISLLRLVHVQVLDVDRGGDHEREAKQLLRRGVLFTPADATKCWNTLLTEVGGYATAGQSADRSALQQALSRAGIDAKAPRSFQRDIDRLEDLTASTLKGLEEYSRIEVGGHSITIRRPVATEFEAGAAGGHLLVLGLPGAGKSGALYELARTLQKHSAVVLLAVDQIEAASLGTLRNELDLKHDLMTVLASWTGRGPGYVIIDALDAARSDGAIKTLQSLIHAILSSGGRWHVVASVRKFDLRYNAPLRRLFHGSPLSAAYTDPEFFSVRHISIPTLTPGELSQLQAQAPVLASLVSGASPLLQELLNLPFNLRLLAELLDVGLTPAELEPVRTQIELLDRYWRERIRRHDDEGEARELVLQRVTTAMIARRSLRISKTAALGNEAASGPFLNALLRFHVLAEWTTQTGATRSDFITFPHHLLFDYAGARLYVPPEADDLVELLSRQPDLLIAIRPSLELHFQRLWHHDQPSFWDLTFRLVDSNVNEVGKLLGPSVAAVHATQAPETAPLVEALNDPARQAAGLRILKHILATLLMQKTIDTPWIECLVAVTASLEAPVAFAIRPYLVFLSERVAELRPADAGYLGILSRRLLSFALTDAGKYAWLASGGIVSVAITSFTDVAASIEVLRDCITPAHLTQHGYLTFPMLARQCRLLTAADLTFVGDLYIAAFAHHDESDDKTFMNDSQIFSMGSNRKQDYEMGLYQLAEYFPHFLEQAPRIAIDAMLKITDRFVRAEHPSSDPAVPVWLDDTETTLLPDYSSIWGRGFANHHDEPFRMLQAFQAYFEKLSNETQIREIVKMIASSRPSALVWRSLLSVGSRQPQTVGRVIRSLAWDRSILIERDTTELAGTFLTAIFPLLTPEERARVEGSILNIPETVPLDRVAVANRFRDRLFGCLDAAVLVTEEGHAHAVALQAAGGAPINRTEPRFEGGAVPFTPEDFLRDQGVPVDDPEHQRIHALIRPLQDFTIEFLNDGPPAERVTTTLPAIRALEAEMPTILRLHAQLGQEAVAALLQAVDAVLRGKGYLWDSATIEFLKTIILRYVTGPSPSPDLESTGQAQSAKEDYSNCALRIEAAKGLMSLAGVSAGLADELRPVILKLASDPEDEIRFEFMNRLMFLFKTAPALMWKLLERLADEEQKGNVLRVGVSSMQRIAGLDAARIAALAEKIFVRLAADDDDREDARLGCSDIFAGLAVHQSDATSLKMLDIMIGAPTTYGSELRHIIFGLGGFLHDEKTAVRIAAFALLGRILDAFIAAKNALDARFAAAPDQWQTSDREFYGEVLKGIDEVATRIHLTSGAFSHGNAEAPAPDSAFFKQALPLLKTLASMAHPHTAHAVNETLAHFVPLDPGGVLLLIAQSVKASAANNYQYDPLAEGLIVTTVERYLAEFRPLLRERPESHVALMEILDIFVRVGWPQAHQLTYRLGDIYR